MAVVFIQEWSVEPGDRSTANYDAVAARLGDVRPDGLLIHTAGFDDGVGVFRIMDVWASQEQAQRFIDGQLMPVVTEVMASEAAGEVGPPERVAFYELHDLINP